MASRYSTMMLALLLACLVMTAQSTKYSLHLDRVCDFRGTCKTVADCAPICKAARHDPTRTICLPDPNGGDSFICCCRLQ
ncbi:hypothetical protein MUK42_21642 [Musa troglodytarum]|uniref:Uncharacterized protein n=1 Tax=Musa troglodytarum TaxID=320322 RepID=A0A9E7KCC9_9LILI|nr:hypothetical protein MUK42_21642 [Musa troglodytarum]